MRKRSMAVLFGTALLALAGAGELDAKNKKEDKPMQTGKKILVVYFSHSGNTRAIAGHIHDLAGGDIFELQPVDPYPAEYKATVKQAKEELLAEFKPKLKNKPKDLSGYDVVFIGTPNWWNSIAGPVRTFLSEYDLAGKTVVPFVTHAGSGLGRCDADVARLCPKSTVLEGMAFWGSDAKNARQSVAAWLRKLELPVNAK